MKKQIMVSVVILFLWSFSVLAAWGASRTISGNDVTVNIVPGDGFDVFTITETVTGATIVANSWGAASCGLANNRLTCDYEGTASGAITYQTTGSGSVSGTIDGVKSSDYTSKSIVIAGDKTIPSTPGGVCGDGMVDAGETCDNGALNQMVPRCVYGEPSCQICNTKCELVPGITSWCGDARIDSANGETCDDGNQVTETCTYGDEAACQVCDASCQLVAGEISFCGDSVIDSLNGEQCDGANLDLETCVTLGFTGSGLTCANTCQRDTSACTSAGGVVGARCGDGTIDTGEACDDSNTAPLDGCSPTCTPEYIMDAGSDPKQKLLICVITAVDNNPGLLQRITGIARCLQASPLFQ